MFVVPIFAEFMRVWGDFSRVCRDFISRKRPGKGKYFTGEFCYKCRFFVGFLRVFSPHFHGRFCRMPLTIFIYMVKYKMVSNYGIVYQFSHFGRKEDPL